MLAGYITARSTHLAQIKVHNHQPRLMEYQRFENKEFSNFDSALSLYLRKTNLSASHVCLGVAGPVFDNSVTTTNLPWKIEGAFIKEAFSFKKVSIINDLEATAHGMFLLNEDRFFVLNKGEKAANGHIGLISAGTGLGEALIYHDGQTYRPYPSEGGHVGFSPGSQQEVGLWEYVYGRRGFVEAEDVISLGGLEQTFEYLHVISRTKEPDWYKKAADRPAKLIEMALSGKDENAVRSLDLFVECLAAEAANLALKGMTRGGIYIGGIIAPQIITALEQERFLERFAQKGKMASLLAKIPVSVIMESKTPLLGAGSLAFQLSQQ